MLECSTRYAVLGLVKKVSSGSTEQSWKPVGSPLLEVKCTLDAANCRSVNQRQSMLPPIILVFKRHIPDEQVTNLSRNVILMPKIGLACVAVVDHTKRLDT